MLIPRNVDGTKMRRRRKVLNCLANVNIVPSKPFPQRTVRDGHQRGRVHRLYGACMGERVVWEWPSFAWAGDSKTFVDVEEMLSEASF